MSSETKRIKQVDEAMAQMQESVIASGWTWDSLQDSARRYKRLLTANPTLHPHATEGSV